MKHRIAPLLLAVILTLLFSLGCAMAEETDEALLEEQYQAAMALYKAEDFAAAAEAFDALGDYEKSKAMANDSRRLLKRATYLSAIELYQNEQYYEAYAIFEELGKYERSKNYLYYCTLEIYAIEYKQARDLQEAGDYEAALLLYGGLDGYRDSKDRIKQCEEGIAAMQQAALEQEWYNKGIALMAEKRWAEARDAFIQAGPFEGATEKMYDAIVMAGSQLIYREAQQALADGDYARAVMLFELPGDYEDSAQKAAVAREAWRSAGGDPEKPLSEEEQNALDFEKALKLKLLWRVEESNGILEQLGEYNHAAQLVAKVTEKRITAQRLRDDATTEMSAVFTAPDGSKHCYRMFRGVKYWVEARAFCEALGGHLATLTTPEENDFVHSFMWDNGFTTAYFGLMDEERDRTWVWVTGEPVEYTNWDSNEPSYSTHERYGMYFYKHTKGTWNDSHFYEHWDNQEWSYICEWDLD